MLLALENITIQADAHKGDVVCGDTCRSGVCVCVCVNIPRERCSRLAGGYKKPTCCVQQAERVLFVSCASAKKHL